jgi:hypothetical protein
MTSVCAALSIGSVAVDAQSNGQTTGQALPNCAVTTASIGSMNVTEFFGLGGTAGSFGSSFGPMPGGTSAVTAANGNGSTTGSGSPTGANTNQAGGGSTEAATGAATNGGSTANAGTTANASGTGTSENTGASGNTAVGGTTGASGSTGASGNTGGSSTTGVGGTTGASSTTGVGGTTGASGTEAAGNTSSNGTTGTGSTSGTAGSSGGANGSPSSVSANAGNGGATMSLAQSCIRLEVANPSPGASLEPGGYVVEGFAFDPTAPASMGSGITGIQVFLGDPNNGGQIVGSVGAGSTTSGTGADEFGTSNERAAGFGQQFANSGFSVTVQIPERPSGSDQAGQQALFVTATAQNDQRVGTVAVPVSVMAPTTTTAQTP